MRIVPAFLLAFCLVLSHGALAPARAADLVVYTALEDDELSVYLDNWEKKHPETPVQIVRDSTGIVTAKLLAEKDNPQADVVWCLAATSLLLCEQQGLFLPYDPQGIERIKKGFKDNRYDPARWVGCKAWMTGFCTNEIEAKRLGLPLPRSFQDLLDPVYKGYVVMPNPASSGTGFLTVSAVLQMMGEEEGWNYLDKLHQNVALYTHSGSKPAKLAGKGEFPVGISFGYRGFKQKAKGEPLVVTFPKEGSGWDVEANALIRKPRIKDAAKTFLDWAISDDAMLLYSRFYPIVAADIPVEVPEGYPRDPSQQLIENDLDWASSNRMRILKEWSRRYEGKSEPK